MEEESEENDTTHRQGIRYHEKGKKDDREGKKKCSSSGCLPGSHFAWDQCNHQHRTSGSIHEDWDRNSDPDDTGESSWFWKTFGSCVVLLPSSHLHIHYRTEDLTVRMVVMV